jgi:prepilin-type N-terminal cleavage/methylation domain-containing protein
MEGITYMEILKNEKGVTLLEVLISMAILSIILISFMNFFPQMGFINKQNEDKVQAINLAKDILIKWQDSHDVSGFLVNSTETTGFISTDPDLDFDAAKFKNEGGYYYFETTKDIYNVKVRIKNTPDKSSSKTHVHSILVQLLNNKGNVVSETYGYVKR